MLSKFKIKKIFRDRFRTTINVLGDSLGAGLVDVLSKAELEAMPESNLIEGGKRRKSGISDDVECHTTPI
jgi:hypothetical protein